MTLEEAWQQSYLERQVHIEQLTKIADNQRQQATGEKIMRAKDVSNRP